MIDKINSVPLNIVVWLCLLAGWCLPSPGAEPIAVQFGSGQIGPRQTVSLPVTLVPNDGCSAVACEIYSSTTAIRITSLELSDEFQDTHRLYARFVDDATAQQQNNYSAYVLVVSNPSRLLEATPVVVRVGVTAGDGLPYGDYFVDFRTCSVADVVGVSVPHETFSARLENVTPTVPAMTPLPTRTPVITWTMTSTPGDLSPTATASLTDLPPTVPPTSLPTDTPTVTASATATQTATMTPGPTGVFDPYDFNTDFQTNAEDLLVLLDSLLSRESQSGDVGDATGEQTPAVSDLFDFSLWWSTKREQ